MPSTTAHVAHIRANLDAAFARSFLPNDGVGLAREEFIISTAIKAHPLALLDYERLDDASLKAAIARRTVGYLDKAQYFVDRLAQGVVMIAAAFYPKDVIVWSGAWTSRRDKEDSRIGPPDAPGPAAFLTHG